MSFKRNLIISEEHFGRILGEKSQPTISSSRTRRKFFFCRKYKLRNTRHLLLTMLKLPRYILDKYLKGELHKQRSGNDLLPDMMIETQFMKFGKGASGIIAKITNPRAIQI